MTSQRVSVEELVPGHGDWLNEALILTAFDRRRRDLSVALCGEQGAFAGYDVFERNGTLALGDRVVVEAVIRQDRGGRHQVEYQATVPPGGRGFKRPDVSSVVVRAVGWTLTPGRPSTNHT